MTPIRKTNILRILLGIGVTLALLSVIPAPAGTATAADEETGAGENESASTPLDLWDWWFPGYKEHAFLYPRRMMRPLRIGNNNFLHHLVLLPPLESFRTLESGRFAIDLRFEGVRNATTGQHGSSNRFDASFFEAVTDFAYGLTRQFEVRAGFNIAWFRPDNEDAVRLTQAGETVFPPEDFDPKPGVGNVRIGLKILSAFEPRQHLGLATLVTLKIPVGKTEFLSSGRGDVSITFHGTARVALSDDHHLFAHGTAGVAFFDEENVFPEKVYLNPSALYGIALVFPLKADQVFLGIPVAFVSQIQGHVNAFRKLDINNSDPFTLHGGIRLKLGPWVLDGSAGFGLSPNNVP
ncbi:MAG: hypothetical protein ACYTHN_16045, partial [Planctomycetota bacterium]